MRNDELNTPHTVETIEGFEIVFTPLIDYTIINEDWSDDEELRADTVEKLNNYDLTQFTARIEAKKAGVTLSTDYLGCCIYESEEDFYIKDKDDYYQDMKTTVLTEAKKELTVLIEALKA